jgi:hypothetical protein
VFDGLLEVACRGSTVGRDLARRVDESWERILQWKSRTAVLRRAVDVAPSAVQEAIALLPADTADLATFRFDRAGLARLKPALAAAETRH